MVFTLGLKSFLHKNTLYYSTCYAKSSLKGFGNRISQYILNRSKNLSESAPKTSPTPNGSQHLFLYSFNRSNFRNRFDYAPQSNIINNSLISLVTIVFTYIIFVKLEKHEGHIVDGKCTEKRISTFANGEYEGDFADGKRSGRGIYTFTSGSRYEGEFLNDKFHGKGIYTFANGDRYEGEFLNYKFHGKGILTFANGNQYEGDFLNGMRTGKGILTLANGNQYEGDFLNGMRTGKGILTFADGNRYESLWFENWPGEWKKNKDLFTFNESSFSELKPLSFSSQAIILQSSYDHNGAFGIKLDNPQKLSNALKIGGYENQIEFFHSKKDLEEKIKKLDQKINLVWIRAHGSGPIICCNFNEYADDKILSKLNHLLTNECSIVLESCNAGMPNMLAQKMLNRLCNEGKKPTIVAPNGSLNYIGINIADLKNGKLTIPMLDAKKKMENVSKIFKCPT